MMDKILAMLRRLEWSASTRGPGSGFMDSGGDGALCPTCPICHGIDPESVNRHDFVRSAWGHREDCELANMIGELEKV